MSDELDDELDLDEESDLIGLLSAFMEEHNDEFLKDENIKPDRLLHRRPDVNAFLLLDKLIPGDRDMVSAAEHDEIFLDVEPCDLMKVASDEDLLDLIRCGVMYDESHNCLSMVA